MAYTGAIRRLGEPVLPKNAGILRSLVSWLQSSLTWRGVWCYSKSVWITVVGASTPNRVCCAHRREAPTSRRIVLSHCIYSFLSPFTL